MSASKNNTFIKDSQVVKSIMKELGIEDFDEQVIRHLLGFNYSKFSIIMMSTIVIYFNYYVLEYSTMILEDAQRYSKFANKDNIDVDDVKLAIHFSQDQLLIKPPEREVKLFIEYIFNYKFSIL